MFPLLLAFALFLFFTLVGKALLEAVRFPFPILRSWLVAPAVGLSVIVLLTLNLNQLGLPIKNFAWWMTAALVVCIAFVFFKRKPTFPVAQLMMSLGIALFATVYSGWPALKYSFGWEGFANHDMANYCFSAVRFLNSGFYRIPTLEELSGTDYTQHMWFLYGPGMFRCGGDLILAWVSALSKLHPWEIAMPTIMATALCQIWAAGALVLVFVKNRRQAYLTMGLLSLSPFFHHGTLIQVMPQVGGLTLLLALCTFCMNYFHGRNPNFGLALRKSLAPVLIVCSLGIYYPEVLPFAVLSIGLFHAYALFRKRDDMVPLAKAISCMTILWIIIGRQSVITALGTIRFAFGYSFERIPELTSFEAARLPSVASVLFGFQSFYSWPVEPYQSILVAVSLVLFSFVLFHYLIACLQARPCAFLFLSMLAVGLKLFADASSFGLFKLGMYVQPLLMAGLAHYLALVRIRNAIVCSLIYCTVTFSTLKDYLNESLRSTHKTIGTFSISKPISNLHVPGLPADAIIASSTPYIVNDVILASALVGIPLRFLSREVLEYYDFEHGPISKHLLRIPAQLRPLNRQVEQALRLSNEVKKTIGVEKKVFGASFRYPFLSSNDKLALIATKNERYRPFNNLRDSSEPDESNYFQFLEPRQLKNYLFFKASSRGGNYYDFGYDKAYWQMEKDPMITNRRMYAVGKFLLFQILDSDPNVRMRVSLTKTVCGPNRTALPARVVVMGESQVPLPLLGNGAANVFTEVIQPKKLEGIYYLAIDFNQTGERFPVKRSGLMRLFNADVPVDTRQIVAFARDISVVNEKEYQDLDRPLSIDFSNPSFATDASIEFSGIHEDGWVSTQSFFTMGKSLKGNSLELQGMLPGIKTFATKGNEIEVCINGHELMFKKLGPGAFKLTRVLDKDSETTKIHVRFKNSENLPNGDDRPVSAKLVKCSISHDRVPQD